MPLLQYSNLQKMSDIFQLNYFKKNFLNVIEKYL